MAGTVTVTRTPLKSNQGIIAEKVQIDWLSDASGNADSTVNLHGFLLKAITDPSGSAAPTDNYDITLVADGIDQLGGALADRDTANNEMVYPTATSAQVPIFLAGDHTFTIANAGNAKQGTVYLYLRERL